MDEFDLEEGLEPARTLEVVTAEIITIERQVRAQVLSGAIEVGRRLVEAKAMVPYGGWGDYIRDNLNYSPSTAQNFMKIFEEYGASQQNIFGAVAESQTLGNLPYTKALALIALPESEREVFVESHDVEGTSTRELNRQIKELTAKTEILAKEKAEALEEAECLKDEKETLERNVEIAEGAADENKAAVTQARLDVARAQADLTAAKDQVSQGKKALRALEQQMEELKNRPVEVAVAEPTAEMVAELEAKTMAQARGEFKAQEEQMQRDMEKALKDLEKAKAEALEAQQHMEKLEKALSMADSATAVFKVLFEQWQEDYQAMIDALGDVDAEKREKLTVAVAAVIEGWSE